MKRLLPVLLLSIVLLNFFGVLPVFHLMQQNIRSEVKSRIKAGVPESELHKITFAKNEKIAWVEGKVGKEFRKGGNMYDVVRQEEVGKRNAESGNITYYCINDKEEKVLFENLDNLCQQEQDGSPVNKAVKDYFKNFSQSLFLHLTPFNLYSESSFSFPTSDFRFPTYFSSVPTPPPNC